MKPNKNIARIMLQMSQLKEQKKRIEAEYSALRDELLKAFKKQGSDVFVIPDGDMNLKASRVVSTSFNFRIKRLRKRVGAKAFSKIVRISIDMKKLQEAIDSGLIDYDQLRGTYSNSETERVLIERVRLGE